MQEFLRFALLGLGLGALYSLTALGLVLIYRGSGVLNFAQGAIGVVGAYVEWELRVNHGLPFALSLVAGVLASAVIGALTHLLVMRPLRRASPLARIVGTLGVLVIVQSAVILKYGPAVQFVPSELPTTLVHISGNVVIPLDRLILFGIGAGLSIVLAVVYRYTRFGLATSAVAENQRAAASFGWSPDLIATVNWALGCALAGFAAILIAPIVTLQVTTMTNLVLAGLAAALVANFRSFTITFIAGMAIGIAETVLARYWSQPGGAQSVPFFVIVAAIVLTGRALPLRDFFLQRLPSVGRGRVRPELVIPGVIAAILLLTYLPSPWVDSLIVTLGSALVILSIVVLTGYTGQISLGQFALAGLGAYVAGRLISTQGWPFWAAALAGILAALPIGIVFALPAVRARGINLAVVTLGLATAIQLMIFSNSNWTGGLQGTAVGTPTLFGIDISPITHDNRYGYVALAAFVIMALAVANLRRGRVGRRLLAVRTNERAAAALGVSVPETKLYAFALASSIAATGGIVLAFQFQTISFTMFDTFSSISYVAWAFLGGIGFLMGPIFGAPLAPGTIGTQIANSWFGGIGNWVPLIGGVLLIIIVVQNQDGIAKEAMKQYLWLGRKLRPLVSWIPKPPWLWTEPTITLPEARRERVASRTLTVRDLSIRYGSVVAVESLSLDVKPGQIVGLIGPNGAGKTTAIDGITGFTRPTRGRVRLDDVDISSWSVTRRARSGISRSFQSLELFEDATVLENLRIASDPRDRISYVRDLVWPKAPLLPGEVVASVQEFDLIDDLTRTVQDLPYGKRRLLAIARAVATRPSVLLLDEPAAGLTDVESQELADLVRRLADEWGMAILLIEHDMTFVMAISDEIVVLDFGRKIAQGTPMEVRNTPVVIQAYLGEPAEPQGDELQVTGTTSSTNPP
jgi:sulfate-transporting ATPase